MLKLRKTKQLEYVGEGIEYRFTFARVSGMQDMRYQAYRAVANDFVKEQIGVESSSILTRATQRDEKLDANHLQIVLRSFAWARIITALQSIEERPASSGGSEPGEWVIVADEESESWKSIDGFINEVPPDLIIMMDAAASECNSDLWFVRGTEQAKKKDNESGS